LAVRFLAALVGGVIAARFVRPFPFFVLLRGFGGLGVP
jgi:hypothetical protein